MWASSRAAAAGLLPSLLMQELQALQQHARQSAVHLLQSLGHTAAHAPVLYYVACSGHVPQAFWVRVIGPFLGQTD